MLDELVTLSRWLGEPARDLAILGEGNTSARRDDRSFWVKASGSSLETVEPANFVGVRFDGALAALDGPDAADAEVRRLLLDLTDEPGSGRMPSIETFLHAYLLSLPGVSFVGHVHPVAVNALLCAHDGRRLVGGRIFPDEIVCCGPAVCWVEYTDPGLPVARLLRQRVETFRAEHDMVPRVILMESHGMICPGRSVKDVQTATAMYVKTARIVLGTLAAGGPKVLSDASVARIHTRPDEHYRQRQLGGSAQTRR
jgi:rhamnose utilization protein RhaD (predicted bifunctional aldolase and dehydrogenase)